MTEEELGVLTLDTDPAKKSVKDLRNELRTLRDTLIQTEKDTDKWNEAMARAAEIQHQLKEQMEEVNARAMDFGQIASNITKSIGGIVGGFQAAKAALNLFGIENEAVLKSLQKMQSLMAISQALPAIDSSIKAFKRLSIAIKGAAASMNGLKAALVSTGIGALVVAVGLLAANWDKVTDAMKRWGILSGDTKKKIEEQRKKVEELNGEIAKLQNKYADWEKQQKISKLNADAKKSYDEISTSIEGLEIKLDEVTAKREKENAEQARGWKDRWNQYNQEGLAILDQIKQLKNQQDAILANADSYKELKKQVTSTGEAAKKAVSDLELLAYEFINKYGPNNSIQSQIIANLITKYGEVPIKIPIEPVLEDEEEADTSFEDAFRQKIEGVVESLRNAFLTPEEQYENEIHALDLALRTKLIKEQEYLKLRDALNREQTQREIQRYATAANSIGSIFTSLGDLMEDGTEEQKALQIMGATINMLGGITAAIAGAFTTHSGPWDIALAALQAAAIAASGAATIAKMSKTTKDNAKSSSSYRPNTSSMTNLIAPVQYTRDVDNAQIEGAIKDSKVYVVESDITDTQNRVKVSESEATF